jgi:hypothetical protein
MWLVIYCGQVSGWRRVHSSSSLSVRLTPPSGSALPDPGLGASGLSRVVSFQGGLFPLPPFDSWALEAQGYFPREQPSGPRQCLP